MRRQLQRIRARTGRLSARTKAVGMFFATSLAGRTLGIGCQILQVPITMRALGSEAFGLWMTLTGIGLMITFADFGIGQGAQNKLAEAFAAGDAERAQDLWGSVLLLFAAVSGLLAGIVVVLGLTVDLAAFFNLTDPRVRAEAGTAIVTTLLLFCVNLPLGLAQRLAYARQEGWKHNVAQALGSAAGLAGVVFAAGRHWHLTGFIAAALVPMLCSYGALLVMQLWQLGCLDVRRLRFHRATTRELVRLGACFGIQQVQHVMFISLPQVIISATLGAAAVTPYNLAQRLFNLFSMVQNAFMLPLWPAYSEAKARGETAWIRRTMWVSLRFTVFCTIAPMALGAAFAHPLLALWVGRNAALPSTTLVWLMFLWNALSFLCQPFGYMLAGLSIVRRLTIYSIVSAAASAGLMLLLVHRWRQEGVVLGMSIGFLPFLIAGSMVETFRVFRSFAAPTKPTRRRSQPWRRRPTDARPSRTRPLPRHDFPD